MKTHDLIPLFPLNTVLFPGMVLPLHIFEERYRRMVQDCVEGEKPFGVALIRSGVEVGGPALPCPVGTLASIVQMDPQEDGRVYLLAQGEERFRILELNTDLPYLQAVIEPYTDTDDPFQRGDLPREAGGQFKRYLALWLSLAGQWMGSLNLPPDPEALSYFIAERMNLAPEERQRLLELTSTRQRLADEMARMTEETVRLEALISAQETNGNTPPS